MLSRRQFLLTSGAAALAAPGLAGLVVGDAGVEINSVRDTSLWAKEAPPLPQLPRFEGERKVDLVIVGGGYTGLACAYYAKKFRPDWSVVVLESHTIGSGASSRASGSVSKRYVGLAETDMPVRGFNRLRNFIDTEEIDCDFSEPSVLRLLSSKSAAQAARANSNPAAKWISPEELRERAGTHFYTGGIDTADRHHIHPAKLVAGHARAALRLGVELFEHSPATNIEQGKPAVISTPNGILQANHVCIATNAYTPRLGLFEHAMFPLHQYTLATRKLSSSEIQGLGLDRWALRYEKNVLPITFALTPSGHFFVRMVLGYASRNSSVWQDMDGAKQLATRLFEKRYPGIAGLGLEHGWGGLTGHTAKGGSIAGAIGDGNIHVSVAYNGSGIMPSHNNGYLTACNITGHSDDDTRFLTGTTGQLLVPGSYYRSMMFKPGLNLLSHV